jgi:glutamate synthase domain-containing protein 2
LILFLSAVLVSAFLVFTSLVFSYLFHLRHIFLSCLLTTKKVYEEGYEWLNHSLWPQHIDVSDSRTLIGGSECTKPYSAALLNVSAMSYGALSDNAILALNRGAKQGGFYHNTGEGGISKFHREPGGDIVWNVGTGYFGCRNKDGSFCPDMFKDNATTDAVKMIEIKLSQGAKPAHGGMLPKEKISPAIAEARGLGAGPYEDCNSPPRHSAFNTPYEFAEFIATVRELSGGKPVGFKLCVGRPEEFAALVRAFVEVGTAPDFITVDGAEGGTGAAPPEFSNRVGMPLHEGLTVVKGMLRGAGLRSNNGGQVKLISSGRGVNGFDLVKLLALGADVCNSARAMMFALGCIQALACNTNRCPTGITTNDPMLMAGLDVEDKALRVAQYQAKTVNTALEIVGACGLDHPSQITTEHIWKRFDGFEAKSYADIYKEVPVGCLLDNATGGKSGRKKPIFEEW